MREVRPELQVLINSGYCSWHTTLDITLTDGNQLHLSTGEIPVNRFEKIEQYLAKIPETGIKEFSMSVDIEVDELQFQLSNVDTVIGRLLCSSVRRFDGAEAILGILFIDPKLPIDQAIWDAKMPGQIMAGEVGDEVVDCSLISSIDAITIAGRTIASEFQWQEPISNVPSNIPAIPNVPGGIGDRTGDGRGRYGDYDPLIPSYLL